MAKYRLIGLDCFDYEEYECGIFDTYEEAAQAKREHEIQASKNASSESIADRYHIESQGQCKHCDATFFGTSEMVDHALKKHHDIMRELGYSEKQLIRDDSECRE